MALVGVEEASCSSSSRKPSNYHVFLSFRGEDTRNTFAAHLYTALFNAGFCTFKDDDGIERGESIKSELEKAIKEARSSIIVFSKDYASSKWCLDELVMILQRNTTSAHKILPVFYHVKPTHVKNQTGSFAKAFCRHEERIEIEIDETKKEHLRNKLEEWRAALKQVGGLAGMTLAEENNESEFIQNIVKEIRKIVNRRVLYVDPYIVGMESRVKDITSWLEDDSDDVNILVIHGTGGVGKTTIAKHVYNVYNLNSERFEACSFLANVRDKSKQLNGLVELQKQLLSDISGRENEKIYNVDEGIIRIGDVISCKKVLVLIDDVEEINELKAIIAMRDHFHPKSKIILTTRRQDLLKANEGYKMHEVQRLYDDESLKLFSRHAFGQDRPIEGYIDRSKEVVEYCGGIPLALEALGSSLGTNSKGWERSWENTLQKLKAMPNPKIQECLKISYETLPDDNAKNIFLHIACFFIGKRAEHFTVRILDACGFYTEDGMKILINRSLLYIDEDNKLRMHQLLRDMGREIVHQESPDEPGQRSRLWRHEDSFEVLKEEIGTDKIKGLFLDMLIKEDKHSDRSFRAPNMERKHSEELGDNSSLADQGNSWKRLRSGLLSWFRINMAVRNSDHKELKANAFLRMRNLALLQLNNAEIKGEYKNFPKKLRWLCWHRFSLESLPSDFPVESLVVLDLRYSSLKQLWKGTKILGMLKILNLSHSHALVHSPDFLQLPNLEKLLLRDCIKLVGLHDSIGKLGRLILLNLRDCKNLRKLPREIFQLKCLEKLDLSGCTGLENFPSDLGKMGSSKLIHANEMNQLSSTTGVVKPWYEIVWSLVSKPRSSPESIYFSPTSLPRLLVTLKLAGGNISSVDIPWVTMCSLKELDLSRTPIRSLPELPMSLRRLDVGFCSSLEMLTNLPNYPTKLVFNCNFCKKIVEVLGSFKLAPIGNVDSEMVNALGLTELDSNRMLQVELMSELYGAVDYETSVLQGLYECGIYSIFIRGSKIPSWFDKKSDGASSISFTIPPHPKLKIRGLCICVAYGSEENLRYFCCYEDFIMVNNETRDQTWVYTPIFTSVKYSNRDTLWLSDWKIATQLMEVGDKVNVWVERSMWRKVKEFGIRIVYDDAPTTSHQNVDIDLSNYRIGKGEYFLRTDTKGRGKYSLEFWWRMIGSQRANTKAEETEYNSDGDPIEYMDDFDWNSPPMVYETLGIARSRKKVFVGSSVVIEEITDSENSAVREGTKMEDSENQRHLKPKCE